MPLLEDLTKLGATLTEDLLPGVPAIRSTLGALIHYVETGTLEHPAASVQSDVTEVSGTPAGVTAAPAAASTEDRLASLERAIETIAKAVGG